MAGPTRVRRLRGCQLEIWDAVQFCRTVFNCGHEVPAAPQDSDAYRQTARECGYGDDTWRLCVEHEYAHSLIAEYCGFPHSRTLWAQAHGAELPKGVIPREECVVLAFQAHCNGNLDALDVLEMYGFEWRELARLKAQLRQEAP